MARRRRKPFTLESNMDKVVDKVREKPYLVLNQIGRTITREVRNTTLNSQYHQRRGILKKTLSYWARKRERDLIIGFRKISIPGIVGRIMTGQEPDPIKPVVLKNKENIKLLIAEALDEIRKE